MLCSLIASGELPRLPKYVAPVIARPIKALPTYTEFAEAFTTGELPKLREVLEKHASTFRADKNYGLAKQCVPALMRRAVRQLTETYLTLSLSQIAEIVGFESEALASRQLRQMIVSGEIYASIDEPRGMVHFLERSEKFDSHTTAVQLETALQSAISLAGRMEELHASLLTDQHYLARVTSKERQPQWDDDTALSK